MIRLTYTNYEKLILHVNDCKYVQIKLDCKYVHIYQNFLVCKQRKINCARHTVEVGISLKKYCRFTHDLASWSSAESCLSFST